MRTIILLLTLLFSNVFAFAQGFIVRDFTADIYLHADGYFDVVENYEIEFTEAKHGIFREIQTDYTLQTADGKTEKRKLVIENLDVPGHSFSTNYKMEQRMNGEIEIKIGDKDKLVSGLQHYAIKYRVHNAFLFSDSLAQFYWNIKPQGWLAIFQHVTFNIHTPPGKALSPQNCFVYAGDEGITIPATDFAYSYTNGVYSGESGKLFMSLPGQSVTVLVKLPSGAIQQNFISEPVWETYGWIGIIVLLLAGFWFVWVKYGKDDHVVAATGYYPPKGIDPAMAGYLINDREDAEDLIALLPHWASKGLITIEEIPKSSFLAKADMKLTRLQNLPDNASLYEHKLFVGLFNRLSFTMDTDTDLNGAHKGLIDTMISKFVTKTSSGRYSPNMVLVSSLRDTFYVTMNAALKDLKAKAQQYYEAQSNTVMKVTMVVAVVLGVLICPAFLFVWGMVAAVSGVVACVFIAFMSFYLRKKNTKGNAVFSELKGFRQFIKVAEINRIKMLLESDPQYFEKTMSYALAFGLLNKWAKKFDALAVAPPSWYTSSGSSSLRMYAFSRSFTGVMATAQSSMVSSPSSSSSGGGGSSGGGFGGGGGGSW